MHRFAQSFRSIGRPSIRSRVSLKPSATFAGARGDGAGGRRSDGSGGRRQRRTYTNQQQGGRTSFRDDFETTDRATRLRALKIVGFTALSLTGVSALWWSLHDPPDETLERTSLPTSTSGSGTPGLLRSDLSNFTLADVKAHGLSSDGKPLHADGRVWVCFKNGVYDITDFMESHPGGKAKISLAAGGSIEPFWAVYGQHKDDFVYEVLEELRCGNLIMSEQEKKDLAERSQDAYADDPPRLPALTVQVEKPFNAESPLAVLAESFITPNDLFFVRNHLPVPRVDPDEYRLHVGIEEASGEASDEPKTREVAFTLEQLKAFPPLTVTATVQCAGNRRADMERGAERAVRGTSWEGGAISNATWTGVRLIDVLRSVGIDEDECDASGIKHVQFEGLDEDMDRGAYGASIPVETAFNHYGDVILAYEMNGEELPRDHGFPVRVIVPGAVGARNIKWLARVKLSPNESPCHWQQRDYKGFSPSVDWDSVADKWDHSPSIQEFPVQSMVTSPRDGERIDVGSLVDGKVELKGYAYAGGGRPIVRVDVSTDNGQSWHTAELEVENKKRRGTTWSWALWRAEVPVDEDAGELRVCVKAIDEGYNTQPENFGPIWNLRGVLSNAWHRIRLPVDSASTGSE